MLCALLTLGSAGGAEARQDGDWAVGTWEGTLEAGPQTLQLRYHVAQGSDGALSGTMDVPAQGATGIALTTVTVDADTLRMTFPVPGGGSFEGIRTQAGTVAGVFRQGPASFPLELTRSEGAAATPRRPQEPAPPYPYGVEEVTVDHPAAGLTLAGTLTLPPGDGPFPGAVLVSGSGPQDRDEALAGHKPFHVLADYLTRRGIAVLRYDDRGVGASTGDFRSADSEDLMADAVQAVRYLAGRPEVSGEAVGIVGHSEGGLVGPMAASRNGDVAYVVMLAGPGVPGLEVLVEQGRLIGRVGGASEAVVDFNEAVQRGLAEIVDANPDQEAARERGRAFLRRAVEDAPGDVRPALEAQLTDQVIEQTVSQMSSPWFRYFLGYDPRSALERTTVPVLALFGERDLQVPPAQSAAEVQAALERAGNRDATVTVLPGLNHLFQEAETGLPGEYGTIEQTMSPLALDAVADWILERFGPR